MFKFAATLEWFPNQIFECELLENIFLFQAFGGEFISKEQLMIKSNKEYCTVFWNEFIIRNGKVKKLILLTIYLLCEILHRISI